MSLSLTCPPDLPIADHVDTIMDLLVTHQVVVVAGETGSGKSTQLPKIAYAAALGRHRHGRPKLIGHTQPRRIAARAVAERLAEEMGTSIGEAVAYTVRFTDTTGPNTRIKVMTDGILLNEFQRDPKLNRYDTLIIDEAHERSLNIDFILGYLARLLPKRRDLRVIITSATIDTQRFANHFATKGPDGKAIDAPIVEVSGRTYPVEVRYRPLDGPAGGFGGEVEDEDDLDDRDDDRDVTEGIVDAVLELCDEGPGDILVFASGEGPIRDATDALAACATVDRRLAGVEIVPLYARLSAQDQHKVFAPHDGRRIVIATNIAETSLTVPGIKYVVDPGLARISRYGRKSKVQRLPIEPISQASANQRSGRCGRIGPGIAIRLYSEEDFAARPAFTEPEILRTNLASVVLQMTSLGLGEISDFPFIQPPERKAVADAKATLDDLDATLVDPAAPGGQRLSEIGRAMARLPVDPRLARLMIAGAEQGVLDAAIICVAAMSLRDVREYPIEARDQATGLHRRFDDPASDYLSILNLWAYLKDQRAALSGTKFRALCKDEYIHFLRWREWVDLVGQLQRAAKDAFLFSDRANRLSDALIGGPATTTTTAQFKTGNARKGRQHQDKNQDKSKKSPPSPTPSKDGGVVPPRVSGEALHKAVLVAMAAGLGQKRLPRIVDAPKGRVKGRAQKGPVTYSGTRGTQFRLGKRSATAKHPPEWVVAGEIVETSGLWAGQVAAIEPEWVLGLLGHQCTYTRTDPRWMADRGQAMVTERISYRGLVLEPGRAVALAPFDREQARMLFIEEGLVNANLTPRAMTPELSRIIEANTKAIEEAHELEDRLRARGLIDPEAVLIERLGQLLPHWVTGATELTKWIRKGSRPIKRRPEESEEAVKARRAAAKRKRERSITFSGSDLIGSGDGLGGRGFPDHVVIDGHNLAVTYTFDPADPEADGMTIHIPIGVLPAITAGMGDWLVPGFRAELFETILRGLPKEFRRALSPISQTAQLFVETLSPDDGPFTQVVAQGIRDHADVVIAPSVIERIDRPAHLRVRWAVMKDGEILATSPDLAVLQAGVAGHMRAEIKKVGAELEADGLTGFPDQPIPRELVRAIDGNQVTGYPALVPDKDGVHVRVRIMPTQATQFSGMMAAHRQLLAALCKNPVTVVNKALKPKEKLSLTLAPHGSIDALAADMVACVVDDLLARSGGIAWDQATFAQRAATIDQYWKDEVTQLARVLAQAFHIAELVQAALATPTQHKPSMQVRANVLLRYKALLYPGCIAAMGATQVRELPRYLDALRLRLLALPASFARDERDQMILTDLEEEFAALQRARIATRAQLNDLRWQIEELHVQLFAQRLGTAQAVSERRIRKQIRALTQQA